MGTSETFQAQTKADDDLRILDDDHVEFLLSLNERARAAGLPSARIIINPAGAV